MFIEGLRTDSLYIFGTVRISQLVGFLCFIGFGALLVVGILRSKKFDPQNKLDALLIPFSMTYCGTENTDNAEEPEKSESIEDADAIEGTEYGVAEDQTEDVEKVTENISEYTDKNTEDDEEKETEEEKNGEDN